jgi:tripartite-type tricarboxylate transporter receptor subunit TctC
MNTIVLDPERKATFQADSFAPIISQVVDPCFIFVRADSPYKTLKDLIDDAKKRPGGIRASTTGIFSDAHLGILMMEEAAGVKFRLVHFDGGAQQMTATLGGQVDVTFDHVGGLPPRIKAGAVRGLAILDRERTKFLPDIPTTVELGYPGVITASTRGVMGPKGIPDPIVKKIQEVFLDASHGKAVYFRGERIALGRPERSKAAHVTRGRKADQGTSRVLVNMMNALAIFLRQEFKKTTVDQ